VAIVIHTPTLLSEPATPADTDRGRPSESPSARVRRLSMAGARIAGGAALCMWAGDAVLLGITRSGASWGQWAQGIGGAAFVSLSTALVVGRWLCQ